jgi:thiol-disulfide isomerase/thioredoxin
MVFTQNLANCVLLIIIILNNISAVNYPSLYEENSGIVLLHQNNFVELVYGLDKASFVEFYAHWCGACRQYRKHWIELARDTQSWHANVVQIGAINCALAENYQMCMAHNIDHYPTLKLVPPNAEYELRAKQVKYVNHNTESSITDVLVDFLSVQKNHSNKWPDLSVYT